jgi:hypothetical protein
MGIPSGNRTSGGFRDMARSGLKVSVRASVRVRVSVRGFVRASVGVRVSVRALVGFKGDDDNKPVWSSWAVGALSYARAVFTYIVYALTYSLH